MYFVFIEILFKILLFKGGVLIYAEHCIYTNTADSPLFIDSFPAFFFLLLCTMSQIKMSPSNESGLYVDPTPQPAGPSITTPPPNEAAELEVSSRGRRSTLLATSSPRRRGQSSPPSARPPTASPASSYRSAGSSIPLIEKWTVLSLRQALITSDVQFSRGMNKAELYDLYITL